MTFSRREFLGTTALAVFAGSRLSALGAGLAFLIVQDAPAAWKLGDIAAILGHLRTHKLGTTHVASHFSGLSPTESGVGNSLLSEYLSDSLLEVVAPVEPLYQEQRLWHLRAAYDLRLAAGPQTPSESGGAYSPTPVSIFQRETDPPIDFSAFRSAGFRVRIVRPKASGPAALVSDGRDQLSIIGGTVLDLFDPELSTALGALSAGDEATVLHLSLAGGEDLTEAQRAERAGTAAELIAATLRRLGLRTILPRDYFLLGGAQVPRDLALLIDAPDPDGILDSFVSALAERDLPFSRLATPTQPGDCARIADSGASLSDCVLTDADLPGEEAATVLVGEGKVTGLGPDIRMHFDVLGPGATLRLDQLTLGESDRVLTITAADVATPPIRTRLLRALEDTRNLGQVRFHDVPGLRDRIMASDPVIRRYWSLRRRRLSDPAVTTASDASERQRLLDDAALAWSFFENHIFSDTGLAAGTVSGGAAGRVNSEITLWDVASQINAVIAASELSLVTRDLASEMLRKAVGSLPSDPLDGGRLPPSNFSARTLRTTVAGFDSCDAGRLGIALARAVEKGFLDLDSDLSTLKDWTLDLAVNEGRHFNHRGGTWQDATQSHCTDYILSGFAFLGQKLTPQYDWPDTSAETEVIALYRAAFLGAVSTEPFALQAIESGTDGPTQLILDALFDAQLGWFEETGRLRCISEAPINREPWFIYSGLRLDREGPEAWVIGTIPRDADFATEEFRAENEIISAKAAYLWRAVHPHAYSDRLVKIIREKARIPGLGFSVGVYADTLEPMPNYTDINTNGIILSAIAHILARG